MMEDMNEINDALGRNYGVSDEIDEADLDAELAGLEDELEGLGETEGKGRGKGEREGREGEGASLGRRGMVDGPGVWGTGNIAIRVADSAGGAPPAKAPVLSS